MILHPSIADRVHQRDVQHPGTRGGQVPVQPEHRGLHIIVPVIAQQAPLVEQLHPPFLLAIGCRLLLFQRLGQQPERMAQPDVIVGQIPSGGREVVRDDRCHGVLPPVLGWQRLAVRIIFEPEHRSAQDAPLVEVAAYPRLDSSEVLTDHERVGTLRLQHDDADERVVVIADVGALARRTARRNPPQPKHADDVVDANPAGVAERGLQHASERRVGGVGEPVGSPRRLPPVLTHLVVTVWWSTDGDFVGIDISHHPGIGGRGAHPDSQVGDDANGHAGIRGGLLGVAQLLPSDPLQPLVEGDLVAVLLTQPRHSR